MTMPKGFRPTDDRPKKKDLEDHIKQLGEKLSKLNYLLSDKVTPYHIREDQVTSLDAIRSLDESINEKIKSIKGKETYNYNAVPKGFATKETKKQTPKQKGFKIKHLLFLVASLIIVIGGVMYVYSNPTGTNEIIEDYDQVDIVEEYKNQDVELLPTLSPLADKDEKCKVAEQFHNDYWLKNCQ